MHNAPPDNREKLLLAARELFREQGCEVSVDAIVCRAEVARQTFYNHFESKRDLLAEAARRGALEITMHLDDDPENLRGTLLKFAWVYRGKALSPDGIASYRMMCSQSLRFPDLAREVYECGLGQVIRRMAEFLDRAMERGCLRRVDSVFAVELLMAMVIGQDHTKSLFGVEWERAGESSMLDDVVDGFLRILAVTSQK